MQIAVSLSAGVIKRHLQNMRSDQPGISGETDSETRAVVESPLEMHTWDRGNIPSAWDEKTQEVRNWWNSLDTTQSTQVVAAGTTGAAAIHQVNELNVRRRRLLQMGQMQCSRTV